MYPDQDQKPEPNPYSIDYLEEIAPKTQKPIHKGIKLLFILLGGFLFFSVAIIAFGSINKQPNTSELLAARLKETVTITKGAQKKLKSNQLRSINSNLTLFLTNTNRDLAEQLTASGLSSKNLSKTIIANEKANAEALTAKLEDARLNATYDRTYAREMAFLLETTGTYMESAYSKTKSSNYKEFLKQAYDNLTPIQEQLAKFNDSAQ